MSDLLEDELAPDPAVADALDVGGSATSPKPLGTVLNAYRVLTLDPRWQGRIWFDDHANVVHLDDARLRDVDVGRVAMWLDRVYGVRMPSQRAHEAIYQVADKLHRHPVRDYLDGLAWDGVPRCDEWLVACLGVEDTPLNRALGRMFLISAVARIRRPGCKVDTVLVLTGRQGARKSSALKVLSEPWFSDSELQLGNKDSYLSIQGIWIYEVAELQSFKGRDATAIKSFLSSATDNFRPPYGRENVQLLRQVVFSGTTNEDDFLTDGTGSRRFWPVEVRDIDLDLVRAWRPQLWAEAQVLFDQGEPWYLSADQAAELALANRRWEDEHPWQPEISAWACQQLQPFRVIDVARGALHMRVAEVGKPEQMAIAKVLRRLGFTKARRGQFLETVWSR